METIAPYYKALAALLVPFLTAIGVALAAGSDAGSTITGNEWITAIVAGLLAGGVVFAVPNKPAQLPAPTPVPDTYEPRHGSGELGAVDTSVIILIAAILFIICAIVWLVQAF